MARAARPDDGRPAPMQRLPSRQPACWRSLVSFAVAKAAREAISKRKLMSHGYYSVPQIKECHDADCDAITWLQVRGRDAKTLSHRSADAGNVDRLPTATRSLRPPTVFAEKSSPTLRGLARKIRSINSDCGANDATSDSGRPPIRARPASRTVHALAQRHSMDRPRSLHHLPTCRRAKVSSSCATGSTRRRMASRGS